MAGPNYASMIANKKVNVRLRAALEAPVELVTALLKDANKRVRRAAAQRLGEGAKG